MRPTATPSALPKYIQISEMLIREIAAGHLVDGSRLPPERDMAQELGISVGTLRKSLSDLAEKGLLERVHGSGNYVRARPVNNSVYAFFRLELVRGGGLPSADVLSVDPLPLPDGVVLGPSGMGHRIRRLRWLGDTLIALEEIWLDGDQSTAFSKDDLSDSLYLYYRDALGLVIASAQDEVGVAQLPYWTPADFHLNAGETTGYIERLSRSTDGAAVEFSRTWFDYQRSRYVSRMGKG